MQEGKMQGIQIPLFGSVLLGIEMHLQLQPRPGFYAEIPKLINSCPRRREY